MEQLELRNILLKKYQSALTPPEKLSLKESAEKYLSVKLGDSWVGWDSAQTPYMIEPMNMIKKSYYNFEVFIGGVRGGKTEGLLKSVVADAIACDPSDVILVHTKKDTAEAFSKKEISPILRSEKLSSYLSKNKHDNNILNKFFSEGQNLLITYPVEDNFRGKSAKYGLITEYDAYPECSEGCWSELLIKRTLSYGSRGMTVIESTPKYDCLDNEWIKTGHALPTAEGITAKYNLGDRRKYYWLCPHCGEAFTPDVETLSYDVSVTSIDEVSDKDKVFCICPTHGCVIEFKDRRSMNYKGFWMPEGAIYKNGEIDYSGAVKSYPSYYLSPLCAQFLKWSDIAREHYKSLLSFEMTGSDKELRTFYNTFLGLPYTPISSKATSEQVNFKNYLDIKKGVVPDDILVIFASVDCQGGKRRGFEVAIWGIRSGGSLHIVDRYNIRSIKNEHGADIAIEPQRYVEHVSVLETQVLDKQYPSESGDRLFSVAVVSYDTNGEPGYYKTAYDFFKASENQSRLMPLKGASVRQSELVVRAQSEQIKDKSVKSAGYGDSLFLVATNLIKDIVSNVIEIDKSRSLSLTYPSDMDSDFFKELVSEVRDSKGTWSKKKVGAYNEALDLIVYAKALIHWYKLDELDEPLSDFIETTASEELIEW